MCDQQTGPSKDPKYERSFWESVAYDDTMVCAEGSKKRGVPIQKFIEDVCIGEMLDRFPAYFWGYLEAQEGRFIHDIYSLCYRLYQEELPFTQENFPCDSWTYGTEQENENPETATKKFMAVYFPESTNLQQIAVFRNEQEDKVHVALVREGKIWRCEAWRKRWECVCDAPETQEDLLMELMNNERFLCKGSTWQDMVHQPLDKEEYVDPEDVYPQRSGVEINHSSAKVNVEKKRLRRPKRRYTTSIT